MRGNKVTLNTKEGRITIVSRAHDETCADFHVTYEGYQGPPHLESLSTLINAPVQLDLGQCAALASFFFEAVERIQDLGWAKFTRFDLEQLAEGEGWTRHDEEGDSDDE